MAKMITRSVILYKYTLIKTSKAPDGSIVVEDSRDVKFSEKMGARKMDNYMKTAGLTGYVVGAVEEVVEKYGMTLEAFMSNAELIID